MELPQDLEKKFQTLLGRYPIKRSALVPMALYGQDALGYVSDELVEEIARRLDCFHCRLPSIGLLLDDPAETGGKYHVQVCTNVSCMLRGGNRIYEFVQKKLEIGHREVTKDGMFSLEEVECIGRAKAARPAGELRFLRKFDHLENQPIAGSVRYGPRSRAVHADYRFSARAAPSRNSGY